MWCRVLGIQTRDLLTCYLLALGVSFLTAFPYLSDHSITKLYLLITGRGGVGGHRLSAVTGYHLQTAGVDPECVRSVRVYAHYLANKLLLRSPESVSLQSQTCLRCIDQLGWKRLAPLRSQIFLIKQQNISWQATENVFVLFLVLAQLSPTDVDLATWSPRVESKIVAAGYTGV